MNRKCAIFLPNLEGGGAERVMLNLVKALSEGEDSVDLLVGSAHGKFKDQVPENVNLINFDCKRVLKTLFRLTKYIRVAKPDTIVSSLSHANIITIWAKKLAQSKVRIIITEHNTLFKRKIVKRKVVASLMPFLMKWFYGSANEIVAVSYGVAESLSSVVGIKRENIRVIYNPVVTPELKKFSSEYLDHPWFERKQEPVIVAVGRLTEQKGFEYLIRAFADVVKYKSSRLIILGEGEKRKELEDLIAHLKLEKHIILPGFVSNPYKYIAGSDIFVLSSLWEGLPTVLIEALALGIPILSTNCPSGPKEILENGKYGRLIPIENIDAISNGLLDILNNLKREKEKAMKHSKRSCLFEYDKILDDYKRLIYSQNTKTSSDEIMYHSIN